MKVLIYSGSHNKKNSCCEYVARVLENEICSASIQTTYLNAAYLNIGYCIGCTECFRGKKCLVDDDIKLLKRSMYESDLIVIISPVYVHQVPGSVKVMIDRLAYLTHLMPFIGKAGIAVSVSSTNGNSFVSDYLEKVMEYWGLTVLDKLDLTPGITDLDVMESYIINLADKIKYYKRHKELVASDRQKQIFEMYAQKYRGEVSPESQKWKEQGYNGDKSLQDLIDIKRML